MIRAASRFAFPLTLAACAASPSAPAAAPLPANPPPVAGLAPVAPQVELRDASSAVVGGKTVTMDGVAEGLAWPALRAALDRKTGDRSPLTIAAPRDLPISTVLRAAWSLRDADVRLQTPDAAGVTHVLELRPKPDAPSPGCHLAVFVAPNGDLRIAAPGGPRSVPGPDAASALARALVEERNRCAIRWVAFGAEKNDAAWGSVFDVAWAVDRGKSAGEARYVLGEPVHYSK
ncbi:MAG TPA: hypothetical protein VGI39_00895 [Polyangiaceae bacterium]|jgi:hypothetical protein